MRQGINKEDILNELAFVAGYFQIEWCRRGIPDEIADVKVSGYNMYVTWDKISLEFVILVYVKRSYGYDIGLIL
ncbi:MAG: hypothetical protein JWO15_3593 [Sphingomonadales bacterium]|nr:hypothetical protein [Sphingomonadales bacterium]